MKVLLVATVQSHICQFHKPLVKILKEKNIEVHVAARDNLAEKNGLALDFVDKVFDVPFQRSPKSRKNITAYKQLKQIINNGNYDIIHCNTPMGGILARLAARKVRKKGTKVFYTAHGFHFYKGASKKSWLVFYPIEKWFAKHLTDKLITIVSEDFELAKLKFKTNVYHIHGVGVNEQKYLSVSKEDTLKFRKENGYDGKFIILCTGELNKNKNQTVLIEAMPQLLQNHPNTMLLLAGNGPEEANLKAQIKTLNLDENVKLLGYRTDLEVFVNCADLVVSVSKREGLGLNVMEAMICSKPVIASNNRGHRELILNGVTGVLLENSSPNCISKEIARLVDNDQLVNSFSTAARDAILPFTSDNVEKELKEIYFS